MGLRSLRKGAQARDPGDHRRVDACNARGSDRVGRRRLPRSPHTAPGRRPCSLPVAHYPVCVSSITTGAHERRARDPHLMVPPRRSASSNRNSFGAVRREIRHTLRDTLVNMNAEHLGRRAVTLEALADASWPLRPCGGSRPTAAARRVDSHTPGVRRRPWPRAVVSYNLYPSKRPERAIMAGPGGRLNRAPMQPLSAVTASRDGSDFLVFYLLRLRLRLAQVGPGAAHDTRSCAATTQSHCFFFL